MLHEQAVPRDTLELLKRVGAPLRDAGFYLAGGTALALRLGHRISVDLDFFHPDGFDPPDAIELLEAVTGESPAVLQQTAGSVAVMLCGTKVEILEYRYPMLEPVEDHDGIPLCPLADNTAMKLSAIMSRGAKKDFVDLSALLATNTLPQMLGWFGKKFPNVEPFAMIKSLTWFEDAEEEPDPEFLDGQSWPQVKSEIVAAAKEL